MTREEGHERPMNHMDHIGHHEGATNEIHPNWCAMKDHHLQRVKCHEMQLVTKDQWTK